MARPTIYIPNPQALAKLVKARRVRLGLKQDGLPISKAVVSQIENAKSDRYVEDNMIRLGLALHLPADWLDRVAAGEDLTYWAMPSGDVVELVESLRRDVEQLTGLVAGLVDEVDALGAEVERGVRVRRSRAAPEEAARAAGS